MPSNGNNRTQEIFKGTDKELEAYSKNRNMSRSKYEDDFNSRIGKGSSGGSLKNIISGQNLEKAKEIEDEIKSLIESNKENFDLIEVNLNAGTTHIKCKGNEKISEAQDLSQKLSSLIEAREYNLMSKTDQIDILSIKKNREEVEEAFLKHNADYFHEDYNGLFNALESEYDHEGVMEIIDNPVSELIDCEEASISFTPWDRESAQGRRELEKSANCVRAFLAKSVSLNNWSDPHSKEKRNKGEAIKRYLSLEEEEADSINSYLKDSIKKNGYNPKDNYEYIREEIRKLPKDEEKQLSKVLDKMFYPSHIKGYGVKKQLSEKLRW